MLLHQVFSFNSPVWFNVGTVLAAAGLGLLHPRRRRHDGLDPQLVPRGGPDLQGRLRRRPQPLPHPLVQGAAVLRRHRVRPGLVHARRRRVAPAPSSPAAPPGARRRWSCSTSTTPTSRSSSRPRRARRTRSARCATPGFDMDLGGKDITSVQYQNANNSVRVTDEFMRAVEEGTEFGLRARATGEVIETVDARDAVPQDRPGRLGVRRPRHPVRRHHQRLAHQPGDRPDHRVQPVLGVHAPGQLVLQPGVAEPAEVPHATTTRSTRRPSRRSSSWSSPRWTSRSASPTSRPRRSATPPARTASSASATPTSARC